MKKFRKDSILHLFNYGHGFMRIAYRSEARNWPIFAGRICFFAVLMLVFSRLWQALYASGLNSTLSPLDMLWYLAATEWMVLSVPAIHLSVEEDLRKGHYASLLTKPVTYIFARLAEASGQLIFRLTALAPAALIITYLAAGGGPRAGLFTLLFIPLGILSALIMLFFQATIGLSALWLQDSFALYLIWQKLLFILGGLMLPLTIYPEWLQEFAAWLPFYALLFAPARLMWGSNMELVSETALLLFFWGAVAIIILLFISRMAERFVVVEGG